eukprot:9332878-Karenia_brevis.AAC.1
MQVRSSQLREPPRLLRRRRGSPRSSLWQRRLKKRSSNAPLLVRVERDEGEAERSLGDSKPPVQTWHREAMISSRAMAGGPLSISRLGYLLILFLLVLCGCRVGEAKRPGPRGTA